MGRMACRCAGDSPVLKIKKFRALLDRFVRLYIMVYAEFASVIDLQFPGLLCYDAAVGVACTVGIRNPLGASRQETQRNWHKGS